MSSDRSVTKLPIGDLEHDNVREVDPEFVQWLMGNIRENGLTDDLEVYAHPTAEGKYKIFDGHNRHAALLLLNKENPEFFAMVPCVVRKVPKNPVELRIGQLLINIGRKSFTAADISQNLKLFRNMGMDEAAIATRLGKSPSWVSSHLKMADDACIKLMEASRAKKITQTTALQLASLDAPAQEKWLGKILKAKGKTDGGHSAARAESAVLGLAFQKDRPAGMKPKFPKPAPRRELGKLLAELWDMRTSYTKAIKLNAQIDVEFHEPHLEGMLRGAAMVFGIGNKALDEDFAVEKWFEETFGDKIDDNKWFE